MLIKIITQIKINLYPPLAPPSGLRPPAARPPAAPSLPWPAKQCASDSLASPRTGLSPAFGRRRSEARQSPALPPPHRQAGLCQARRDGGAATAKAARGKLARGQQPKVGSLAIASHRYRYAQQRSAPTAGGRGLAQSPCNVVAKRVPPRRGEPRILYFFLTSPSRFELGPSRLTIEYSTY